MKMQLTSNPLITSDEMETSVMGMDSSGMDQACYFLRDKIYSDKVGAVVREYITNALDEHVKYNIDLPVRVTLTSNEFIVRDFAKGLSEEDVRNVFGMYFKSTKRTNNAQSGMFGLGSKAAHCYTDSFYIKSHFNGVCTLYTAVLGGGKSGVPVGQIMKISEEPTRESGLEITVEYNPYDNFTFKSKIDYIISTCSKNIEFIREDKTVSPLSPVEVLEKKGYTFKLYDMFLEPGTFNHSIYTGSVYYKMGEIVYKTTSIENVLGKSPQHVSLPKNNILVVEIPIGKMSLPISRESFEDTPSNNRVLDDIKNVLNEMFEEEFSDKKDLGIAELLSSRNERTVSGKFFLTSKAILYPYLYPMLTNMHVTNITKPLCEVDNKKVVCLIPDKESADYWIDKFTDHVDNKDKAYYYINEFWLNKISDLDILNKLNAYFLFKKVKSTFFDWPKDKTEKNIHNVSAKVMFYSRYLNEHFKGTALEIHNFMRKRVGLSIANDIEEAKEQNSKMKWEENPAIYNNFKIRHSSTSYNGVWTNSKTMVNNLKSLGWIEYSSPEDKLICSNIVQKERERENIERMKSNITLSFLNLSEKEKLIKKLSKKEKHLKKASCILEKIKNEKTLRGTIFNTLYRDGSSYYFTNYINRKDLRKILLLK